VVKHPVTPVAVPTEVESGLYSVNSAQPQEDDNKTGWLVAFGIGILLLGAAALRMRKN
jgi:LPXTG-motif cell wall-anchored protein